MWNTIKPPTGHGGLVAGGAAWPPGGHVVIRTESPVDYIRNDRHDHQRTMRVAQVSNQ